MDRPIDVLNNAKGKRILVRLKNNSQISGVLMALDLHLNMWLDDAQETKDGETTKLGTVLIRGDTIVMASPAEQ